MKTKVLLTFCIILIAGCTNRTPKPMSDAEKVTIKNEVKKEFDAMVEACNKVDLGVFKYFLDSPDFMAVGIDGIIIDFAQFKKANEDVFKNLTSLQFTGIKEDVKILSNDYVLYIWQYNAEIILKSGEKIAYDKLTCTYHYKKIEGLWKIVYYHESGLPPVVTNL